MRSLVPGGAPGSPPVVLGQRSQRRHGKEDLQEVLTQQHGAVPSLWLMNPGIKAACGELTVREKPR